MIFLKIYILGVLFAIIHFSNEIKKQGSKEYFITILFYVLSKKTHYKYTLRSWFYFINI